MSIVQAVYVISGLELLHVKETRPHVEECFCCVVKGRTTIDVSEGCTRLYVAVQGKPMW